MENEIKQDETKLIEKKEEEVVEEKENEIVKKEVATGIKQEVSNEKALEEIKTEKVEEKFEYPSLFVDEDKRIKIEVDILYDPSTGKPLMMIGSPADKGSTKLEYLKRVREWMEFTYPDYNDMIFYRENSMVFEKEAGQFLSDPLKMRINYLRFHLKDWSLKGNDGKKIELKFDNNRLSEESVKVIGKLTPSLVDIFLTEYEREAMLG